MRVFVTGATGWIGSAVVKDLLSSGHKVTGLTTTTGGARKLQALGAKAHVGRLQDHALLREGTADSDGVIHLAFIHGLSNMSLPTRLRLFAGVLKGGIVQSFLRILAETESGAIRALGAGLERSKRPLVVASGVLALPQGKVSTERDNHVPTGPNRSFSETAALDLIARGVRSSIVRLPPTVHGAGEHGFMARIIAAARKKGVSPYIGVPFREIASLISTRLNVPTVGIPAAKAGKHFGIIGNFVGLDNPASSEWTRNALGWRPEHPGLLADMDAHYFGSVGLAAAA
jgi:hypothetical protein